MIKLILIFIAALLLIAFGIYLCKKKRRGAKRFLVAGGLFIASGIVITVVHGTSGYLIATFLHGIAFLIMLVALIRLMNRKAAKVLASAVGAVLVVSLCCLFIGPLRRSMALHLRPFEHGDGISRSLFVNCFYKDKVPGFSYVKPQPIEYYSEVTGMMRPALVLLPIDYDEQKEYPVLYLLHGLGGNEHTWIKKKADIIIQNMNYLYDCPEMVVVFPNSNVNESNSTSGMDYMEKCKYYDKTEEDLVGSLMPYINENYSVRTQKEYTAIAGNSMGGRNALYTAFTHQDLFDYVGGFSSVSVVDTGHDFFPPLLEDAVIEDEGFECLMIMTGREDFICGNSTYDLHAIFNKNGIEHIFYDVIGVHQDLVWQNAMYNFMNRIKAGMKLSD